MLTLESLCESFLSAKDDRLARDIVEKIARVFYSDPRISRILESELRRSQLFIDRKDDLRHDTFLAFTQFVLPKLKYPERAIGAVHQTARNCVKRLNSNRYVTENESTLRLDDPDSDVQLDDLLGADDTQEDRIIKKMMTQRAKEAIEAALANPTAPTKKTLCWVRTGFPTRPENDGRSERLRVKTLPPAQELNTRPPRYRDLNPKREMTETVKWFLEAKENLGLTMNTLAERLDILPATLRSYVDRRVNLPLDIYERMRRLTKSKEGKERQAVRERTKDVPMPSLVADWLERTGLDDLRDLAEVLGIKRAVLFRWSRPTGDKGESRPYPETIYDCESKVAFYAKSKSKRRS